MHCGVIRQSVSIESMNTDLLRSSDKGVIRFKFLYHPEYLKKDSTILLREGRTKILGVVTRVYEISDDEERNFKSQMQDTNG
jgi:GTPase